MADKTGIEWTEATWNPIIGCSVVSPGCKNCYAMKQANRLLDKPGSHYEGTTQIVNGLPVWTGKLGLAPDHIMDMPLRWQRPRKIFVNSMGDVFHESVPDQWIDRVFQIMESCSISDYIGGEWKSTARHTFQLLTKRADRMRDYMIARQKAKQEYADKFKACPTPEMRNSPAAQYARAAAQPDYFKHIWLGVSVEDQARAEQRVPALLETPAAVRFLSCEPLIGPVTIAKWLQGELINEYGDGIDGAVYEHPIHWVIVGGESGPGSRPMHPYWARMLRDEAVSFDVPFFFKQWGEWVPYGLSHPAPGRWDGERLSNICDLGGLAMARVGKKKAGSTIDGRQWKEFPL